MVEPAFLREGRRLVLSSAGMVSEVKNDQKDSNIIHNLFDRS